MGRSTKSNRIILFVMGYVHLIISTSIGLGLGLFIGYNLSSNPATSDLHQQQNSHHAIIHRKTYADLPWDGKSVLRGKTFTLQPSNAVTSRPIPISTSTTSPTTKHSSKSSKMPSRSSTLPEELVANATNTTNTTILTPCPTSNNSSITLKPTTLDSIPSQPVPSSPSPPAPATKRPSRGISSKSSKSPSSTRPQDIPEVVINTTDSTSSPTASSTSATNVTSNSPTLKPSLITTSHPTSTDAKTSSPSSPGDVKCTCTPTTSDVLDSATDSPTAANNTDDQTTLSPTITPAATTLPPTLTATTTMPSSNATIDKTCAIVEEETCCTQPTTRPEEDKKEVCEKLGCNLDDCSAEGEESVPTASPTCNKCEPLEQEVCCNQEVGTTTIDQKRVCKKLGCRLSECPSEPSSSPTSIETTGDPTTSPSLSSIPTKSPSDKPSLFPTANPTKEPATSSPSLSTNPTSVPPFFTTLPTESPTDGPTTSSPSLSSNPSSEPPFFTTLPTKIPIVQDTLPPTVSTLIPTIATGNIPEDESASPSFGSTPTVSKETTGPPTMKHIRGEVLKQLGSNDYKPHFVFTSKIETDCAREEGESGCLVKCIETTKLYEADILINETSNNFLRNCPDGEETSGGDGTSTSSIVKTIHIPIEDPRTEVDDHDDAGYDDYN